MKNNNKMDYGMDYEIEEPEVIVYDDYKIKLSKYPRNDTDKRETDIIIILFLMHEEYLRKLSIAYNEALRFYNNCKEYFYIFQFEKRTRRFEAKEIIQLINTTNEYIRNNPNINKQMEYFQRIPYMDRIFYFYIKNKDFYMNLYESLEHAKMAYFERREYNYRIIPPTDYYNGILPKIYNAIELMEINAYTQHLVKNKIIGELPIPKYFKNK